MSSTMQMNQKKGPPVASYKPQAMQLAETSGGLLLPDGSFDTPAYAGMQWPEPPPSSQHAASYEFAAFDLLDAGSSALLGNMLWLPLGGLAMKAHTNSAGPLNGADNWRWGDQLLAWPQAFRVWLKLGGTVSVPSTPLGWQPMTGGPFGDPGGVPAGLHCYEWRDGTACVCVTLVDKTPMGSVQRIVWYAPTNHLVASRLSVPMLGVWDVEEVPNYPSGLGSWRRFESVTGDLTNCQLPTR